MAGCLGGIIGIVSAVAAEPNLPAGLQAENAEPELPAGLEGGGPQLPPGLEGGEPKLPPGLNGDAETEEADEAKALADLPFQVTGFVEGRGGVRLHDDEHERRATLAEARLQLEFEKDLPGLSLHATTDLVYDTLADSHAIDLETGDGFLDLREANAIFSPTDFTDAKVGRQILTWGTGDLVFINDLFPKDFNSFFLGRDEEYLKAPSDAAELSAFSDIANLDIVYTPVFDADRFIDGSRVSFFNPALGRITGRDAVIQADRPDDWFRDDEWALRLYRNFAAYEGALYGYDGFWKSPAGSDPVSGRATFPRLSVVGGSLRGPLGKGIANLELGYYDSREDRDGDDPNVRNSEVRLLAGYEQELAKNLTLGLQYYLEHMVDYDDYLDTLPAGTPARDENRHVLTQRLTWLTLNQNLEWSLFAFLSPSDVDAYLRPRARYKVDDNLSIEAGGNLFTGRDEHTFFGQFEDNSNLYLALRYGF
ncbi:MAG: hypothetical protein ACE5Q3_16720 [Alphaproteobacteria bacterium]